LTTFDNSFYALNVADGAAVGATFSGAAQGGIGIVSAGAAVDYGLDRVFFASRRRPTTGVNTVWALDLSGTGVSYAWGRALDEIDGGPTLCGTQVYVGTNTGQVYALATADGATLWSYPTGDGPVKSFVFPDCVTNSLYLSTTTKVWGLTVSSPTPNWPAVTSIPSPSTPTFLPGTPYLFVGGGDGGLYQLDLSGANSTTPPAITFVVLGDGLSAVGRPTIDRASGIAYVGTDGGAFYAVEFPIP
jgi:outer membrane protein assembly factor BamB